MHQTEQYQFNSIAFHTNNVEFHSIKQMMTLFSCLLFYEAIEEFLPSIIDKFKNEKSTTVGVIRKYIEKNKIEIFNFLFFINH